MDDDCLARQFEAHRIRLRAVAYRMLGSLSEADDAVQESWLRLSRADTTGVADLGSWLTTVVARVCLDMLRARSSRREEPLGTHVPEPIVSRDGAADPEYEAMVSDAVGLGLLVVLDTLTPGERLAFVLHDMFAVPFDEIGSIVGRSPAAARQLASRGRRRVRQSGAVPLGDPARQQAVVGAFLAAARDGDFDALLALLHPEVALRADAGGPTVSMRLRGARTVAEKAFAFSPRAGFARPALVNGAAGIVAAVGGQPVAVLGFTVTDGKITQIDILADPVRLRGLDLAVLDPS
ncbi:MAG TPA: sigma-70 family RNA polymerase sigma factor [Mycobacteriales bacterium]|nr:sigma-70 family RNA polymerase sigma factor [Mycobacteriales bacterium]